jgi:hypothetical protein
MGQHFYYDKEVLSKAEKGPPGFWFEGLFISRTGETFRG